MVSDATVVPPGKVPADLLDELLGTAVRRRDDVIVGPLVGEDAAAFVPGDEVVVAAADPITLTGSGIGALAVAVNANDVAVTGARPRWFLATILLPVGSTVEEVREVFAGLLEALDVHGAVLVGGHTEVTAAVTQPVVAGHMLGSVAREQLVTTGGAQPGDLVVQVGPAPIEGAAVLAAEAGSRLDGLPAGVRAAAVAAAEDPGISVVEPALLAARLGATSMHDPTEGGLAAGLHETARAASVGLRVDREAVRWFGPGLAVCKALGADPWGTLASGCLLAAFRADVAAAACDDLRLAGYEVAIIADVVEERGVVDTAGSPIPLPDRDEVARVLTG